MEMFPEEAAKLTVHTGMDLHDLMSHLQQASDLDLLRLRTAIDHLLQSPTRILAVRQHLHVGQEVHFWNLRDNRMQHGRITKFKSDQLLILAENPPQYWWVPYAAVQPDPDQAPLSEPPRPMARADFALGDTVSFEGHDLIQRLGSIVRLNQKTATVSCDGHQWRVPFALLRHVINL
jgi:hypothetical protein